MTIKTLRCPCGAQLRLGEHARDGVVRCPQCQRQLRAKGKAAGAKSAPARPAASTIELRCGCGTRLRADRSAIGKKVRCPKCHQPVPVRADATAEPVLAAELVTESADDHFDFDAVPTPPIAAPVSGGASRSFFSSWGSSPLYRSDYATSRTVALAPGSPALHVLRGAAIAVLAVLSLLVVCQAGSLIARSVMRAHVDELRSQRPSSFEERRELLEEARSANETYAKVQKTFLFGYRFLHLPLLVALVACGVGVAMAVTQTRGAILAVLAVTGGFIVLLIGLDLAMRTLPMMTMKPLDSFETKVPADMWMLVMGGNRSMQKEIWTAGAIEALWGAMLAGFGLFMSMWRYNQNRGNLTLPVLLAIGGALYSLCMLGLANSLSSFSFLDDRFIPGMAYAMLTVLLWTLALFAVLIFHQDAQHGVRQA